jgi:hypothetical protein
MMKKIQSAKKFTGSPGVATRIEKTQPESGYACSSGALRL